MKTGLLFLGLFFTIASGLPAQELTLEQVLDSYYKAGNFNKLSQVKTIIMTGSLVQQDRMPVKIFRVRPDKYMMEYDVVDLTAYQVYDGQTAWMTAPWTGNASAQVMTPERAVDLKIRADMDGILVDWKKKGHLLELAGRDTLNGIGLYKIKVIRKDGGTEYNFIDISGFMLQKRIFFRQTGGKEIMVENFFSDYRMVDGIPFAFTIETKYSGRESEIQLETIDLNEPVDLKIFTLPEKK